MNRLFLTAAVAALILPAAACQDESTLAEADTTADETALAADVDNDGIPDATDTDITEPTPDAADPMDTYPTTADSTTATGDPSMTDPMADPTASADMGMVAHLMPGEISAKNFIGDEVYGSTGEKIADVEDLLLNQTGKIDKLVYTANGTKSTIDFANVSIAETGGEDSAVRVSMTDEQAESAAEFDQQGLNDYRLASEIVGAEVDIAASDDDEARIEDLVFTKDGSVKNVIVKRSAVGVGVGDMYAFDYSKLSIEQGDGGLTLNVSETELNEASKFEYSMDDATDETLDGDAADAIDDTIDDPTDPND